MKNVGWFVGADSIVGWVTGIGFAQGCLSRLLMRTSDATMNKLDEDGEARLEQLRANAREKQRTRMREPLARRNDAVTRSG